MALDTFPTLDRSLSHSFQEVRNKDAVHVASKASGLSFANKLFTFNPKTWKGVLKLVIQADKVTVDTFYAEHCEIPFEWDNTQEDNTYEVIFGQPPICTLDKLKNRWTIGLVFIQYAPLP